MANYGLDMTITRQPLGFCYGEDVTGPMPEIITTLSFNSMVCSFF